MRKIITFLVIILFSVLANAQTDTVRYNEILNDPNSIPNFSLYLSPIYLEASDINFFTIGFAGGVNATLFNRLKVSSIYRKFYFLFETPKIATQTHNNITISEKLNPAYMFEVGGAFIYSDKTASKKVLINLASQQTGNIIVNTVTAVSTNIRKRNSFRFGYFQYQNIVNLSENLLSSKYYYTESGDIIYPQGIAYHDVIYDSLVSDWGGPSMYSYSETDPWLLNSKSSGIYLGIEKEIIKNLIIETETFGKKTNRSSQTMYFDVFYGNTIVGNLIAFDSNPSATIYGEEVGVNKKYYTLIIGKGENELHINKFGFRLGMEIKGITPSQFVKWEDRDGTSSLFTSSLKLELGMKPGIQYGAYFSMTYSILLNK